MLTTGVTCVLYWTHMFVSAARGSLFLGPDLWTASNVSDSGCLPEHALALQTGCSFVSNWLVESGRETRNCPTRLHSARPLPASHLFVGDAVVLCIDLTPAGLSMFSGSVAQGTF